MPDIPLGCDHIILIRDSLKKELAREEYTFLEFLCEYLGYPKSNNLDNLPTYQSKVQTKLDKQKNLLDAFEAWKAECESNPDNTAYSAQFNNLNFDYLSVNAALKKFQNFTKQISKIRCLISYLTPPAPKSRIGFWEYMADEDYMSLLNSSSGIDNL